VAIFAVLGRVIRRTKIIPSLQKGRGARWQPIASHQLWQLRNCYKEETNLTKHRLILTVAAVLAMPGVMVMAQQTGGGAGTQQGGGTTSGAGMQSGTGNGGMNGQEGQTHMKKHHGHHHHHHHKSKNGGMNGGMNGGAGGGTAGGSGSTQPQ
jgi:hypothetical protein